MLIYGIQWINKSEQTRIFMNHFPCKCQEYIVPYIKSKLGLEKIQALRIEFTGDEISIYYK